MTSGPRRTRLGALPLIVFGTVLSVPLAGCGPGDPARAAVERALEVHGSPTLENAEVTFRFRDARFRMVRRDGRFHYERVYTDSLGATVREWMDNESTAREVDGVDHPLDEEERASVETSVHSVIYFAFLPFRLRDPGVRLADLGTDEVRGLPYRVVGVTFTPEGGGQDWEDRFVYWFHQDQGTLDYLAYRYHRDGGGARFRVAMNRRPVDGVIVQDYENYRAPDGVEDIADYPRLLEAGELELLSTVALEDVEISEPGTGPEP